MLFNPASNVKVSTSLWALHTWGPDYRFSTEVRTTGIVNADGVLEGDLFVSGALHALWPEAISRIGEVTCGKGHQVCQRQPLHHSGVFHGFADNRLGGRR